MPPVLVVYTEAQKDDDVLCKVVLPLNPRPVPQLN